VIVRVVESMAARIKILSTVGFAATLAPLSTSSFVALIHNSPRLLPEKTKGRPLPAAPDSSQCPFRARLLRG
jgi:hypothetical protein